ncbi:MAG: hypothetical protein ACKVYV_04665 [Limisphaerales bacterium]
MPLMRRQARHRNGRLACCISAFAGFVCGLAVIMIPALTVDNDWVGTSGHFVHILMPFGIAASLLPLPLFQFKAQWIQVVITAIFMLAGLMFPHLIPRFSYSEPLFTLLFTGSVILVVFAPMACLFWYIRRDGV